MKNHKSIIIGLILFALIIVGFFFWPRKDAPNLFTINTNTTDVPCLDSNITTLKQHIHPHLQIIIEDQNEAIPANIGLSSDCERSIHTHDTNGIIHVESQDNRQYTLGDFFNVWSASGGKKIDRFGYKLEMNLPGKPEELILKDKQEIILKYSK
ncbi:MAG: hypothetical protein AAB847_01420 [Patescibacteria group bacterium]